MGVIFLIVRGSGKKKKVPPTREEKKATTLNFQLKALGFNVFLTDFGVSVLSF